MKLRTAIGRQAAILIAALALVLGLGHDPARAEFGDIVMNQTSDAASIRPVVFPHWFHRVRYSCKSCHSDLGIMLKAGGNDINMVKVMDGLFCGACHDGNIAWSVEQCDLCHSGKTGMPTQTHEATVLRPSGPARAGDSKK